VKKNDGEGKSFDVETEEERSIVFCSVFTSKQRIFKLYVPRTQMVTARSGNNQKLFQPDRFAFGILYGTMAVSAVCMARPAPHLKTRQDQCDWQQNVFFFFKF
jgi:hypothetical protein